MKKRRKVRAKADSMEEFWRRLTTGEIKITETRLPPEEERCRFKRFMEIIHEIDMMTWAEMKDEDFKE